MRLNLQQVKKGFLVLNQMNHGSRFLITKDMKKLTISKESLK